LLRFEKFKKIESIVRDSGLYEIIRSYYTAIAEKSGKDFIIDSSKSASWCKVLSCFKEFDLRIIHLERELPYVAESWKKSVRLPEFYDQEKYMPVKKDLDIIRTWIKVKILGNSFKKSNNYVFVRYKELCSDPAKTLAVLGKFIGAGISQGREIILKQSHSIAGNPIRFENRKTISIQNSKRKPDLPWQRHLYFLLVNRISNLFFR
jgi:hypothetical protein